MWVLPDGTIKTTVDRRSYNRSSRDYMIVLLPFCRLRNIPLVSIKAPADLSASEGKYFKCMEKVMQRTGRFGDVKGPPFGSGEGGVSYWDDNNIQQMCDDKYIDLEDELDELHGKDANMMRLERFMYWYNEDGTSEYVSEWERMNREQYAKVDPDYAADIDDRHDWLLTLNPMSKAMQTMRLQLQVPPCYRQSSFSLSACFDMNKCARYFEVLERIKAMKDIWSSEFELVTSNSVIDGLRTTWSQKAWLEYYPLGIEPLIIFTPPHKDYLKVHSGMDECEHHKEEVVLDGSLDYEDILDRIPRGVDRVLEQKKHIDFEVGERTRLALESLIKNPAEAGTIWDPRMVTYGVAV
ncbi:hypothetical protein WAI453_007451 [Rhynchosporium graminicola]|nr:uncharacterized protein RCO7_10988 [Rhynchosporium commune]